MKWQPLDTLPDDKIVLLYQPANERTFRPEGMIVGSVDRRSGPTADGGHLFVYPAQVGGHEWECEITHPTHWMELPDKP